MHVMHMFRGFQDRTQAPEGKKRIKDAVAAKKKAEDEVVAIMKEIFETIGIDGNYGAAFMKDGPQHFKEHPQIAMLCMRFVQYQALLCDEAELSPEDFQKKLERMQQEAHTHGQGHAHGDSHAHGAAAPAMDPEARKRIIEAARLAQEQMAAMTPEQRARMARAAQQTLVSVRSESPGLSPAELSRRVSEKMMVLQKMIKDYGMESPQLTEAFSQLNVLVEETAEGGASAVPGHAHAPIPSSGGRGRVGGGEEEEELVVRAAVDRA